MAQHDRATNVFQQQILAIVWLGLFVICCPQIVSAGEEKVVFERQVDQAVFERVELTTRDELVSPGLSEQGVRDAYGRFATAQPEVVKVAIVYDGNAKPVRVLITSMRVKPAATIYDVEIPEELLKHYSTKRTYGPDIRGELTVDQIQAKFPTEYWQTKEWGIQKVEVIYRGTLRGEFDKDPYFFVTRLDAENRIKSEPEKAAETKWLASAHQRFALTAVPAGLVRQPQSRDAAEVNEKAFADGQWRVTRGTYWEEFRDDGKAEAPRRLDVNFAEWPEGPDTLVLHKVLMNASLERLEGEKPRSRQQKVVRTDIGTVLAFSAKEPAEIGGNLKTVLHWQAGRVWVSISADNLTVAEVVKLYGRQLPSTLPKSLRLDEIPWARDEVGYRLAQLAAQIAPEKAVPYPVPPTPLFAARWRQLLLFIALPDATPEAADDLPREKRQVLYDQAAAWWAANKDKVVWDKAAQKFILPKP